MFVLYSLYYILYFYIDNQRKIIYKVMIYTFQMNKNEI